VINPAQIATAGSRSNSLPQQLEFPPGHERGLILPKLALCPAMFPGAGLGKMTSATL
jgi:hypothetical protein